MCDMCDDACVMEIGQDHHFRVEASQPLQNLKGDVASCC